MESEDQIDVYAGALEGEILQRYLDAADGNDLAPEIRLARATIAVLLTKNGSIRDLVELIGVVVRLAGLQVDVEREVDRMEEIREGVQRLMAEEAAQGGDAVDEAMDGVLTVERP